ncbi:hypothetical protein AAMO2058_000763900 [Amorphochlora amoebiformis]
MHEDLSRNPILNPQSRTERPHTASPRAHLVTSIHGEGPVLEPRNEAINKQTPCKIDPNARFHDFSGRMKVQAVSRDPILEGGVDNGKPMKKAVPSYEYLTKLRQEGRPYGIRTKDHISTEGCAGETSRNINAKVAWSQHFDNFKQIRSSSHTIRPVVRSSSCRSFVEGQEQQMKPTTKLSVFSEKLKITSRDPIVQPKSQFPTPPVKINNYRRKILHKAFDRSGPEKEVQWKSSVHITQHNKPSSIAQLHGKEGSDRDKRLMRSKVRTYEKTNSYNSSKDVYEYSHSGALGNPRRFERRAEYKRVHEEQLHRHQPTSLAMDRQQHMRSSMNIFHHVGQEK